jgi:hypothetical protein
MDNAAINGMFRRFAQANPEPKGELHYKNPFTLLVAVVLSAQATDIGVNRATSSLFALADTPQKMLKLGLDGLKSHIRSIGLYNTKAQNVMKLSEILVRDFHGGVPADRDVLQTLPGVGERESALIVRRSAGTTLLLNDVLANVRHPRGLGAHVMARLLGFGVRRPRMPRIGKRMFVTDASALAQGLRTLADLPRLERIVVSHGDVTTEAPAAVLRRVADELG